MNKGSVVAAFIKDIISKGVVTVYGDGSQKRDYLYVDDLAEGIKSAMEADVMGVFQLGSGIGTSLNDLIKIVKSTIKTEFEVKYENFRQGEILHTYCDISKAKKSFAFNPNTKLNDGIQKTYAWFMGTK